MLGLTIDKDITTVWKLNNTVTEKGYGVLYQSNLVESVAATGQNVFTNPMAIRTQRSKDAHNQASDYFQARDDGSLYDNLNPIYWANDNYNVSTPSIRGVIKPFRFDNPSVATSYNSNKYYDNRVAVKKVQVVPSRDERIEFNFAGLQSNSSDFLKTHSIDFGLNYSLRSGIGSDPDTETTIIPSRQTSALGMIEPNRDGFINGKLRTANQVKWYSNMEISDGSAVADGLLDYKTDHSRSEEVNGESTNFFPKDGIGAFKILDQNGTTYHFALPVYTIEQEIMFVLDKFVSTATIGVPYAQKWLLTAITGPDFIDSGRKSGVVDSDDAGYFVSFEYGKFSDKKLSSLPQKGFFSHNDDHPDALTKIEIISQDYYLEKITTRTHSALFVKSLRIDNISVHTDYSQDRLFRDQYKVKTLSLDQIILVSNKDLTTIENQILTSSISQPVYSEKEYPGNVLTVEDIGSTKVQNLITNLGIKTVDFKYGNYLNSRKLSLDGLRVLGKKDSTQIPQYKFQYYRFIDGNYLEYAKDNYNAWGYFNDYSEDDTIVRKKVSLGQAKAFSLQSIITPQGEEIVMDYESDDYRRVSGYSVKERLAGSIRVKSITVKDLLDDSFYADSYDYDTFSGASSGVVTMEPEIGGYDERSSSYDVYGYPSEQVFYSEVKRTRLVNGNQLNGSIYEFVTPHHSMVDVQQLHRESFVQLDANTDDAYITDFDVEEVAYETTYNHDLIGSPTKIKVFDANGTFVSESTYKYEPSDIGVITQGLHLLDETYRNYNIIPSQQGRVVRKKTARFINSISTYQPNRLSSVTNTNFLTNERNITYFFEHDFITGQPKVTVSKRAGDFYLSEITPAFTVDQFKTNQKQVGLDYADVGGKNLLSATAYTSSFLIEDLPDPFTIGDIQKKGILSATALTWQNQNDIWRHSESYVLNDKNLKSDGTANLLLDSEHFKWDQPDQHEKWQLVQTAPSMINNYSKILESADIDGVFSSSRFSVDNSQVLISANNARYKEIAFSGAERSLLSNAINSESVNHNSGTMDFGKAHTGMSSLRVGSGLKGFEYTTTIDEGLKNKVMEVAFWIYSQNANFKVTFDIGNISTEEQPAIGSLPVVGDWQLYRKQIPIDLDDIATNSELRISVVSTAAAGSYIYLDDFRVAPFDATVKCFVYDEKGNISYSINNNHFFTQSIYDNDYRVIEIKRESAKGVHTVARNQFTFFRTRFADSFDN